MATKRNAQPSGTVLAAVWSDPSVGLATTNESVTLAVVAYRAAKAAEDLYLGQAQAKVAAGEVLDQDDETTAWYLDAEHKRLHKSTKRAGNALLKLVLSV